MRDGKRVSGAVPYGYYRKPDDKQTLYVDEVSASVVRRIFQLALQNMKLFLKRADRVIVKELRR